MRIKMDETPNKNAVDCCRVCGVDFSGNKKSKRIVTEDWVSVFEAVLNQRASMDFAVCLRCKYRITKEKRDVQQLRAAAANVANISRYKRGLRISPARTKTTAATAERADRERKRGKRLFGDSPQCTSSMRPLGLIPVDEPAQRHLSPFMPKYVTQACPPTSFRPLVPRPALVNTTLKPVSESRFTQTLPTSCRCNSASTQETSVKVRSYNFPTFTHSGCAARL